MESLICVSYLRHHMPLPLTDLDPKDGRHLVVSGPDSGELLLCARSKDTLEYQIYLYRSTGQFSRIFDFMNHENLKGLKVNTFDYIAAHHLIALGLADGRFLWIEFRGDGDLSARIHSIGKPLGESILGNSVSDDDNTMVTVVIIKGSFFLVRTTMDVMMPSEPVKIDISEIKDKQVNLGWGSSKTQFRGPEERKGITDEVANAVDDLPEFPDYSLPCLAWGFGGLYFALSGVVKTADKESIANRRIISIHDSDLMPLACTINTNKLVGDSLSWGSSGLGELIVTDMNHSGRRYITFFEKNGLMHMEFELKDVDDNVRVNGVSWNYGHTVLAVWVEDLSKNHKIQLYTSKNYEWMLKYEIYPSSTARFSGFKWDIRSPLTIYVLDDRKYMSAIMFCSEFLRTDNSSLSTHNPCTICTIDGSNLKFTPLMYHNIPPPFCASCLRLPSVVALNVAQYSRGSIAAALTRSKIFLIADRNSPSTSEHRNLVYNQDSFGLLGEVDLPHKDELPMQVVFVDKTNMLLMVAYDSSCNSRVYRINFEWADGKPINFQFKEIFTVRTPARLLADENKGFIHDSNGDIYEISKGPSLNKTACVANSGIKLPGFSTKIQCLGLREYGAEEPVFVFVSIDNARNLYLNGKPVDSSCSSFYVSRRFLNYTTYEDRLVTCFINPMDIRTPKPERACSLDTLVEHLNDAKHTSRRVERGASIVISNDADYTLILQMPRGNLESINPRRMVLFEIMMRVQSSDYLGAYNIAKRSRTDLNVLIDLNPLYFEKNYESFVDQFKDLASLNAFILALSKSNILSGIYKGLCAAEASARSANLDAAYKARLLDLLRESLYNRGESKYLTCIIAIDLNENPRVVDKALLRVSNLMNKGFAELEERSVVEEAINFIAKNSGVNYNSLYSAALGTYNLKLALFVAEKSHDDPRSYVPFINRLRRMPEYYMKYNIDKHLQRHKEAIENLAMYISSDPPTIIELQDTFSNYVVRENLYLHAIGVLQNQKTSVLGDLLRRVCFEFAQRLSGLSAHSTAGDFYTLADNIDLAIDSYTSSGDWCKALDIAKRVKKDKEYIDNLARVFDEMLCLREKFSDAAKLCIEYLMDYELAALRYAYAGEWDEAFRMSRFSEESEPVVDKLRIMLGEDCASVIKQIDTFSDEIQQKLDKVHETNSQIGLPTARKEFQGFGGHDINDTSSECSLSSLESSLGSRTSFYTDNTSSSRRSKKSVRKAMRPSKLLATPEGRFIKSVADFDDVIGRVEILSRRINGIYKVIFVHSDINTYNELCKACKKLSRLLNDAIDKMRKVKKDNIAILDCVAQVLPEINIPILDINKDKGSPFTTN